MSVSALAPGMTLAAARRAIARLLRQAAIDNPELDARVLICHGLGLEHATLAANPERLLVRAEVEPLSALCARRLAREPVARILGEKEFWGLRFRIGPDALTPRPETECVVEAALAARAERRSAPCRIADLGAGSGAILVALLHELPFAFGIGADISEGALRLARRNADEAGVGERAAFVACDFGRALAGGFDLVVSNPPYVASAEIDTLAPEVRRFEPRRALDGGGDGLACYRAIARDAARLLRPGGSLVVELGAGQEVAVTSVFEGSGLRRIGPAMRDLAGIPRAMRLARHCHRD